MAINRSSISAQPVTQNYDFSIPMKQSRPEEGVLIDPPVAPNTLCGYYNDTIQAVELFVTDFSGTYYIKVR